MPLSDIAVVNVSTQAPGVSQRGFGVTGIASQNATWTERVRSYADTDEVLADFAATTPEYNAAAELFAQEPHPLLVKILRCNTNPVLQRYAAAVLAVVVGAVYKLFITDATGNPGAKPVASFTLAAPAAWGATTPYVAGQIVTNDSGKYYVCSAAGTSAGSGGPTGTGSTVITDGTVSWFYAGASAAVAENDAVVYGLIGAIAALTGIPGVTATATGTAGAKLLQVVANATTGWFSVEVDDPNLIACTQNHAAPASTASAWAGGSAFSIGAVRTNAGNVYQVTGAGTGNSTVAPTGTALSVTLSDGYTWAYLGTSSGLVSDLAACKDEDPDFYLVVSLYNSPAYVGAVSSWIGGDNSRIYPVACSDTACAIVTKGANDPVTGAPDSLAALMTNKGDARTASFFHPRPSEFADAAEAGRFSPIAPGGDNWRMKTLAGLSVGWGNGRGFTTTQITNIKARKANYYCALAGVDVIGGDGKVAANEYIDVIRGRDWWVARLQERLVNLEIQNEKIPFTDSGIGLVEAQVEAQNDEGIRAGLINPGSPPGIAAPVVTAPKSGDVSSADRSARSLNGVKSTWTLAGAINKITVNASILV